jgi:hypothetical protein
MRLKVLITAFAVITAIGLLALPADAAPQKKRVVMVDGRGHTVFVSRDEDGRSRTRIIIQKRSYLDPGTAALPSDRNELDYVQLPNQKASGVLDHTSFGSSQSPLPGPFDLPGKNNPWLRF